MSKGLRQKAVKGVLWSALERFSVQGVSFALGIVMARLLMPEDFGLVGMLSVFVAVAGTFVDSGFSTALIRKQDRTAADDNTVFYFNIVVSVVCYGLLYVLAPAVSAFYELSALTVLLRVLALQLVINSLGNIQRVHFTVAVDFKSMAKVGVVSTIVSGLVGVVMAMAGCGVWSVVAQMLLSSVCMVGGLWWVSPWRPQWIFSWSSFRELFGFGSRLLLSSLLNTLYNNVYSLVIGKVYNAKDLGYYARANSFGNFPSSNVSYVLQRVTFPVLSKMQNEDEELRKNYRRLLKLAAFVVFPLMCGLSAVSYPLVRVLLGEEWLGAARLLHILCFSLMLYPIHAINLNLLQVKGRSDYFLRLEVVKKMIGVGVLVFTLSMGLEAMCWGLVLSSWLSWVVNTYYTGKLIGVGYWMQLRDVRWSLVLSGGMWAVVGGVVKWWGDGVGALLVGVIVGGVVYIGASRVLRVEEWSTLLSVVRDMRGVQQKSKKEVGEDIKTKEHGK